MPFAKFRKFNAVMDELHYKYYHLVRKGGILKKVNKKEKFRPQFPFFGIRRYISKSYFTTNKEIFKVAVNKPKEKFMIFDEAINFFNTGYYPFQRPLGSNAYFLRKNDIYQILDMNNIKYKKSFNLKKLVTLLMSY